MVAVLTLLACLLFVFVPVVAVVLDLKRRDAGPNETMVWATVSVLFPVVGPICYLVFKDKVDLDDKFGD